MSTQLQLRTYVAVAETGSVRGAAQRLVVTDAAVSAALAALTREVGVPLLERQGRGLRLTTAGQTYARYARSILDLQEEALAAARGERDARTMRLRIAAVTTAGEHVLPSVLASFAKRHPCIKVALNVGNNKHVWGLLTERRAELVIAGPPLPAPDLTVHAVRHTRSVVVGSPAAASAFDLSRTAWLVREAGSGTRARCEALLTALNVNPPVLTLGSNQAVVAGAATGLGVALVSRDAVAELLADGRLTEIAVPQTPIPSAWCVVTQPRVPVAAQLLVSHLFTSNDLASSPWLPVSAEA